MEFRVANLVIGYKLLKIQKRRTLVIGQTSTPIHFSALFEGLHGRSFVRKGHTRVCDGDL